MAGEFIRLLNTGLQVVNTVASNRGKKLDEKAARKLATTEALQRSKEEDASKRSARRLLEQEALKNLQYTGGQNGQV